jgi:hypothetical protein
VKLCKRPSTLNRMRKLPLGNFFAFAMCLILLPQL